MICHAVESLNSCFWPLWLGSKLSFIARPNVLRRRDVAYRVERFVEGDLKFKLKMKMKLLHPDFMKFLRSPLTQSHHFISKRDSIATFLSAFLSRSPLTSSNSSQFLLKHSMFYFLCLSSFVTKLVHSILSNDLSLTLSAHSSAIFSTLQGATWLCRDAHMSRTDIQSIITCFWSCLSLTRASFVLFPTINKSHCVPPAQTRRFIKSLIRSTQSQEKNKLQWQVTNWAESLRETEINRWRLVCFTCVMNS